MMDIKKYDFPPDHYPITVTALRSDNREEVWRHVMYSPGGMTIPPLKKIHGVTVIIRVEFANGEVSEA